MNWIILLILLLAAAVFVLLILLVVKLKADLDDAELRATRLGEAYRDECNRNAELRFGHDYGI